MRRPSWTRAVALTIALGAVLGLSLGAEKVQGHGGSVRCEEAPGGGAAFVLALPAADPADPAEPAEPAGPAERDGS